LIAKGFAMLLMRRAPRAVVPAVTEAQPAAPDLRAAARSIGAQASRVGRESVEVRGLLEDTTARRRAAWPLWAH
jgi:hypothetical protein